jgi:Glycosyltransferase family 87/Dolichyl-phosphate-mannose-protein mannosyltransferase
VSALTAARPHLASGWRSFEAWVGTRASAVALFALAIGVFALESVVLPAYPGRDMARYLQTYVQLGYHVPIYPAVLNTRGPLAALGVGLPLELGGWAAEIWLALLYALSIVAWGRVALVFGRRAAALTSVLLLVCPGYGILFHQLASDSLFAATFAGWAVLVARAVQHPSLARFLCVGLGLGALVLVRPANQVLLVMALLPLFVRAPWRDRLAWGAVCFAGGVAVVQSWKLIAHLRYGDAVILKPSTGLVALAVLLLPLALPSPWRGRLAVVCAACVAVFLAVRGLPGQTPGQYVRSVKTNESLQFLYRTFELDRLWSPDNGAASRRVARVVQQQLLPREPYKSYGVDVHEFFSSGSDRVFGDMTAVVPADDLAAATREAIRQHPGTFAKSIAQTFWEEIARRPVYGPDVAPAESTATSSGSTTTDYVVVNGRRLPRPSESQPIPASRFGPFLYTPQGQAQEVWRSPTQHQYVFSDQHDARRAQKFDEATGRLASRIPTRDGSPGLVHRLNQASHAFPPIVVWLVIGLAAFALRRPRNALVALAPSVAGLVVIVVTALLVPSVAEYAAPVSPAFILLTAAGLVGVPANQPERWRARAAAAWPIAGAAAGVAAAVWAVKLYVDAVRGYVDGAGAPHDLDVFLRAAGKVIHGASPYVFEGDKTFAYPPFVAYLLAPLHPLGGSSAAIVWTLLSLAAVVLALWLLGVRDWRCYPLALVYPFTRSAIDLGTIEPLLLLAVAAAWCWRDRVVRGGLAVGVAAVLKLFLWPLAVWLALTRRVRGAVTAVAAAVALALVAWAGIGFAGVGDYPGLLHKLANHESTSSYSVVALGVRAHLPVDAARIISVLVALALLAAAAWVARDEGCSPRERDVATLTLCLAAALAASPIVWIHYFLLLLVPLALTRPRFSVLWLVPFAYYPLGEATWPAGDARKLAIALVATLVLLAPPLLPERRPALRRNAPLRLSPWSRIRSGA